MIIGYDECYNIIDSNRRVASITAPADHTIMYIAKKIERLINRLYGVEDCIVILQEGIEIPKDLEDRHIFVIVANPQMIFDKLVRKIYSDLISEEEDDNYITRADGVTVGRNVIIGRDTKIEQGVFLDHGVIIGDRCTIKRGAIIKRATIGNDCVIYENTIIGNTPFNYYYDGNKAYRMMSVGRVTLESKVEIGCNTVVDKGTISDTFIGHDTKIDHNCHVSHDSIIEENVIITGMSAIGSFSHIGKGTHIYSAKILKRLNIGNNVEVLLNSCVMRDVEDNVKVLGYPAKIIDKKDI